MSLCVWMSFIDRVCNFHISWYSKFNEIENCWRIGRKELGKIYFKKCRVPRDTKYLTLSLALAVVLSRSFRFFVNPSSRGNRVRDGLSTTGLPELAWRHAAGRPENYAKTCLAGWFRPRMKIVNVETLPQTTVHSRHHLRWQFPQLAMFASTSLHFRTDQLFFTISAYGHFRCFSTFFSST